jgi:mRNA-degrading endonuclease RelE of RelBE toxin-antitoxin system
MDSKAVLKVELSPLAERNFGKFERNIQKYLLRKLIEVQNKPQLLDHAVKLEGAKNAYRLRFGDYRVIYGKETNGHITILLILKIGHRKDVYEGI